MHTLRSLRRTLGTTALLAVTLASTQATAGDWTRFRGPNGVGVPAGDQSLPTEWSETQNLRWKTQLPGPGLSSPIVVGDRVFVTCWSGYGVIRDDLGDMEDLQRHLVCVDRKSGSIEWDKAIPAILPEEEFRGMFAENGYASHTPVSDGERVYAFFGKTGVYAFDMDGNAIWNKGVGTGDDRRGWGTASSPILHEDLLIVPAYIEDHALIAFDKRTGEEQWRQEANGFNSTWSTPVLVKVDDDRTDLVISVPYEVWGLNPDNGKLRWYADSVDSDSICSSPLVHGVVVYIIDGRNGSAAAIRAGGSGDVNDTHVLWANRSRGRISTPLYHDGAICWISGGILNRMDAATGEEIGRPLRLDRSSGGDAGASSRGGSGGRGRFGGGRMGGQDYSSPVLVDGKIYFMTRSGDGIVIELGAEPQQIATNRFDSDDSDYSGTPAISDGQLFVRSNRYLYCVANSN